MKVNVCLRKQKIAWLSLMRAFCVGLVLLKILGVIDWSWWFVLLPLCVDVLFLGAVCCVGLMLFCYAVAKGILFFVALYVDGTRKL